MQSSRHWMEEAACLLVGPASPGHGGHGLVGKARLAPLFAGRGVRLGCCAE